MGKIIENRRQGGRRNWQKRVEGRLGAREQCHVCVTHKTHQTHFNIPQVRMINDAVQYRLHREQELLKSSSCSSLPFTPGVSDTLIPRTTEVDWHADSHGGPETKP